MVLEEWGEDFEGFGDEAEGLFQAGGFGVILIQDFFVFSKSADMSARLEVLYIQAAHSKWYIRERKSRLMVPQMPRSSSRSMLFAWMKPGLYS